MRKGFEVQPTDEGCQNPIGHADQAISLSLTSSSSPTHYDLQDAQAGAKPWIAGILKEE